MACGTPVVVSDSGALPEVVGEAAIVVAEGDAAELAKAIGAVVHDPDVAQTGCVPRGSPGLRRRRGTAVAVEHEAMYRAATKQWVHGRHRRAWPLEVVVVAYGQPELLAAALAPLGAGCR